MQSTLEIASQPAYGELLAELDNAAARQIAEELSQLAELAEPHVAYDLAQALPPGQSPACSFSVHAMSQWWMIEMAGLYTAGALYFVCVAGVSC